MNDTLVDYGIYTEKSDIRAHVSPIAQCVYIFKTAEMLELITHEEFQVKDAMQDGANFTTGRGFVVPLERASPFTRTIIPWDYDWSDFEKPWQMSTSEKGRSAVSVVLYLMNNGMFPFWVDAEESQDANVQIDGADILVFMNQRIQVKCDFRAAKKEFSRNYQSIGADGFPCSFPIYGTGNLFIQFAECNPFRRV